MRITRQWLPVLIVVVASVAHADRIYLNNGRHLDGLVESESRDHVTLRVEGGEMKVARRRIKKLRYSRPADAKHIEQAWKRRYFLNEAYVPPGMTALADRLRTLQATRKRAVAALRSLENAAKQEADLRRERTRLAGELGTASEQLQAMDPEADVRAYNERVTGVNQLRTEATRHDDALRALPELKRGWRDLITRYTKELDLLRTDTAARHGGGGELNSDERTFLNRMLIEVAGMVGEFRTSRIGTARDRSGHTIAVQINGATLGRFVVDTGAAVITMSQIFAKRAGIEWDAERHTIDLVLANGDPVQGVAVVLNEVAVGNVKARSVRAVVLKDAPDEGVDGLLGMSFLGRFQFSMNPGSGHLTFTEFDPGE
jgi:clan AA aspartic protease (TIGR02281 family)